MLRIPGSIICSRVHTCELTHFQVQFPSRRDLTRCDQIGDPGCFGLPEKLHIYFMGQTIGLALIAWCTRADGVTPSILAATADRQDVIDGEVMLCECFTTTLIANCRATVGTDVPITAQDGIATPAYASAGYIDIVS